MQAIKHIAEATLTDDPEKAKAEIEAAQEQLNRMKDLYRIEVDRTKAARDEFEHPLGSTG